MSVEKQTQSRWVMRLNFFDFPKCSRFGVQRYATNQKNYSYKDRPKFQTHSVRFFFKEPVRCFTPFVGANRKSLRSVDELI